MVYLANLDLKQNQILNAVLQPLATPPANAKVGQIYYDSVKKRIMSYAGPGQDEGWNVVGIVVEQSAVNGNIVVDGVEMQVYRLPAADAEHLGGVIIGEGITIDENGKISVKMPTKLSELENDEEFIDKTVENLINYYKKTETYTKDEVNELVAGIGDLKIEVVDALPTEGIKTKTIYLVKKSGTPEDDDVYDEYMYINNKWEKIGNTSIDLSNYLTKTGDASKVTVTFTEAGLRSLPTSGEALDVLFGKVVKYLTDLKPVAFSGDYNDLSNTPDQPVVKKATIATGTTSATIVATEELIAYTAAGKTSGDQIMLDMRKTSETVEEVTTNTYTFSINEAYTEDVVIKAIFEK